MCVCTQASLIKVVKTNTFIFCVSERNTCPPSDQTFPDETGKVSEITSKMPHLFVYYVISLNFKYLHENYNYDIKLVIKCIV